MGTSKPNFFFFSSVGQEGYIGWPVRDIIGRLLRSSRLLGFTEDDHVLGYADSPGHLTFFDLSNPLLLGGGLPGHLWHE